ncbi:hypothetical protein J6590_042877 [Homalodisca vitripennis]|nr:hypothetical protein J6590_042877 [Homalodisca vitripennis]
MIRGRIGFRTIFYFIRTIRDIPYQWCRQPSTSGDYTTTVCSTAFLLHNVSPDILGTLSTTTADRKRDADRKRYSPKTSPYSDALENVLLNKYF